VPTVAEKNICRICKFLFLVRKEQGRIKRLKFKNARKGRKQLGKKYAP
jgi:hypothetical protein